MGLVEAGKLKEAAEKIELSYRQTKRIRERVKKGIKAKALKFSHKVYGEFNDQHFTGKLADEERVEVSRETVRKIRRGAGIRPKRKRRGKKHRKRRERKAQEGWMVLWDGSPLPLVRARYSCLLFDGGHR